MDDPLDNGRARRIAKDGWPLLLVFLLAGSLVAVAGMHFGPVHPFGTRAAAKVTWLGIDPADEAIGDQRMTIRVQTLGGTSGYRHVDPQFFKDCRIGDIVSVEVWRAGIRRVVGPCVHPDVLPD
jgi:hypothetical protein